MIRLWTCSPVATRIGATPRAIAACPRMSSGLVGSSIQYGSNRARRAIHSIACSTSQRWLASTASIRSGPISSRTIRIRRMSSSTSAPTLSLNTRPAVGQRLAAQATDLGVVVAEPAHGRRVGGIAVPLQLGRAPRARVGSSRSSIATASSGVSASLMYRKSTRSTISLGRHLDEQLPERLAGALREQVPDRVHDGRRGQVDDPLLGPDPAQLAVADEASPEPAHVGEELLGRAAEDERLERAHARDHDLRAAPDREREPVALQAVAGVGPDHDIGRRVVRVRVHRVGAVERRATSESGCRRRPAR